MIGLLNIAHQRSPRTLAGASVPVAAGPSLIRFAARRRRAPAALADLCDLEGPRTARRAEGAMRALTACYSGGCRLSNRPLLKHPPPFRPRGRIASRSAASQSAVEDGGDRLLDLIDRRHA